MRYTEDFKARVRKAIPNFPTLNKHLEANSPLVGRFLDDSREYFTGKDVMRAVKTGGLGAIYREAEESAEIEDLYEEWLDMDLEE